MTVIRAMSIVGGRELDRKSSDQDNLLVKDAQP
jgi:hypothetical protein